MPGRLSSSAACRWVWNRRSISVSSSASSRRSACNDAAIQPTTRAATASPRTVTCCASAATSALATSLAAERTPRAFQAIRSLRLISRNDAGNRDPAVFPEPDRLDVHRDARPHVDFGVHQCLGQPLARVELQVVYGTLYRRIPTLELAVDLDQIAFKHDGLVDGVYELPLTW
jgi:hypothetical protein